MTNLFALDGEHRAEPSRLRLLGDKGQYDAFGRVESQATPVDPADERRLVRRLTDTEAGPNPSVEIASARRRRETPPNTAVAQRTTSRGRHEPQRFAPELKCG